MEPSNCTILIYHISYFFLSTSQMQAWILKLPHFDQNPVLLCGTIIKENKSVVKGRENKVGIQAAIQDI